MDNRAGEMQVFVRVVEAGSFSNAARLLRMTPSTVSKLIARIEVRLGVRLLERSTRRLGLTAEGQIYYERSQAVLTEIEDVEQTLTDGRQQTSGIVRVNASVAFGILGLEPLLPEFWRIYPNIVIDLSLSDEIVDLYLDRTDVAFRVGKLSDSTLTARRIGKARRVIVASPDYLAEHGTPQVIEDLTHHSCLGFNFRKAAPVWPSKDNTNLSNRAVRSPLLANNGETVRRMARAGAGLARLGEYHAREDMCSGHLVEVLREAGDEEEIHALYLGTQRMPQRVRVFLDFVTPKLQNFLLEV